MRTVATRVIFDSTGIRTMAVAPADGSVVAELDRLCGVYESLEDADKAVMLRVLLLGWNPTPERIVQLDGQQQTRLVRLLACCWSPSPTELDDHLRDPGGDGLRLGVDLRLGAAELCDGLASNLIHPVVRRMYPQPQYQLVFERHDNDMRQQDIDALKQANKTQKRKLDVLMGFAEGATKFGREDLEEGLLDIVEGTDGYHSDSVVEQLVEGGLADSEA